MMDFLFETVVDAYRRGEKMTLDVGERDGYVVIGLTILGDDNSPRACMLTPADAEAVVQALHEAIGRANKKRES
jgi:hypothetical protein